MVPTISATPESRPTRFFIWTCWQLDTLDDSESSPDSSSFSLNGFSASPETLELSLLAGLSPSPTKKNKPTQSPPKKTLKERQAEKDQAAALALLLQKKKEVLPWPFDDLLLLQNYDGRWLDVDQIYECLAIPPSGYFADGRLRYVFYVRVRWRGLQKWQCSS